MMESVHLPLEKLPRETDVAVVDDSCYHDHDHDHEHDDGIEDL